MLKHSKISDLIIIISLYTLSYGLILLNQGLYFDDWLLHDIKREIIFDRFRQAGLIPFGFFYTTLSSNVVWYRILVFISYLAAAFFLYQVIRTIKHIDAFSRLMIVLFFCLLPVNSARIAIINTPYSICYGLFFLGFWLVSVYLSQRQLSIRVFSLIVLFVSFFTNSLLVFYIIVLIYIAYIERDKLKPPMLFLKNIIRYADYLLLPVFFWICKFLFMKSYGLYEGYNQVRGSRIFSATFSSFTAFYTSFLTVIDQSFSLFFSSITFAVASIIVYSLKEKYPLNKETSDHSPMPYIVFGVVAFLVGVYPYVVVGKMPYLLDQESRHQLLVPLGASFLLVYGVKLINATIKLDKFIYVFLVVLFVLTNIHFCISFQRDWFKQVSIIENLKSSDVIRSNTSFLVDDKTAALNANQRTYRFYEYSSLMKEAFGDEKRFGYNIDSYSNMDAVEPYLSQYYKLGDYQKAEPDKIIEINYGEFPLNTSNLFKLLAMEYLNKTKFLSQVCKVISLNLKPKGSMGTYSAK